MQITLYLSVYDADIAPDCQHQLWTRQLETSHAPQLGDEVVLWPGDEEGDPDEGPKWRVRPRWWGSDGSISMELQDIIVDANESAVRLILDTANVRGYARSSTWYTGPHDEDGRPEPKLERGGWRRF